MRKLFAFLSVLIINALMLSSCNDVCSCKKVSCPAYKNANFDQWFPYTLQQNVSFMDSAQKLPDDTILINGVSAQQAYEADKGCINGDNGCSSDKYISSYNYSFSVSYNSSSDWDGTLIDSNYSFALRDFSIIAKGLSSNGFVATSASSNYYNNIQLNGKNYPNVQALSRTDTAGGNYDVYEVYLQKGTGLLAWRSQYANTLFVLK